MTIKNSDGITNYYSRAYSRGGRWYVGVQYIFKKYTLNFEVYFSFKLLSLIAKNIFLWQNFMSIYS